MHFPVVLLPLASIALIILVLVPRFRRHYALPTVVALALGAATSVGAWFSGQQLAEQVGEPAQHAFWGTATMIVALVSVGVAIPWYRSQRAKEPTGASRILGVLVMAASLALIGTTVLAGHSGATAVWGSQSAAPPVQDETPTTQPSPPAEPTPTPTDAETTTPEESGTYTMAEVEANDSAESCWAVIDGAVYDLTEWIAQHPGGADRILGLCGTDATTAFSNQHGDAETPNQQLERFRIGELTE